MHILALSGSLRAASTNTALLRAAGRLAPPDIEWVLYEKLADLPAFNPDLDEAGAPAAVADFRATIARADGLVIASPEYAHGVPGALKNALDWVVAGSEIIEKPTAFFHASSRGIVAQAALAEILKTMSAELVAEATVTIPLLGKAAGEIDDILSAPENVKLLREAIAAFARAIGKRRARLL